MLTWVRSALGSWRSPVESGECGSRSNAGASGRPIDKLIWHPDSALYLLFAVGTIASDRDPRFGVAYVIGKILEFRTLALSPSRRFDQTAAAASQLGTVDRLHRPSGCRRCHDQLRIGGPRELGGQSADGVGSGPFGTVLVGTKNCRRWARCRCGITHPAPVADRLCRVLLRSHRIG